MAKLLQFVSREDAEAQDNLAAFVNLAQHKLTAFGSEAWDDLRWQNDRVTVVFCKHRPRSESRKEGTPLAEPFLSFAKAFIRYDYSHNPSRSRAEKLVAALRMIELALIKETGGADILDLGISTLNNSIAYCTELFKTKKTRYKASHDIERVANFCRTYGFTPALPSWKSGIKKPEDLNDSLTTEGAHHRDEKLPTEHAMLALADLFARANDVESRYYTSIMVLLMCAPNRISEILALSVNCIRWETDSEGKKQMFLRYRAAKGGGPMKKWVPKPMQSVVKEAVARLTKIGAEARVAAKFAYDNPGRFMRHPACTTPVDFNEDAALSRRQMLAALSMHKHKRCQKSGLPLSWHNKYAAPDGPVTYHVLAEGVTTIYKGPYWPHIDAAKKVLVWDALCLFREYEFDKSRGVKFFSWKMPHVNSVNGRMGTKKDLSLFERADVRNPDGSPIRLTTHMIRHWLSTDLPPKFWTPS